ncbi:MAG: 50S ribosomal protein L17 [Candidatus Yanofskybacteria bacterium CG10_big_fil_rev_8_21_14_0_10_46_23]|uniref:Large ribosomal subunit protein bL17 n=1 Tax=Candidatus Yanofskybacteria bacterium CG10_big_fil_rev_8_21_14_0_10_46_23 TaxID=1975098 RepID=A0A2H0R4N7_9BACT|nr:MAG: 50S ribosomal protein L17 [Candidatus Yanofskybacteria bacterium CG10_big_fil_rev_8_21_14_0_10_46_23]
MNKFKKGRKFGRVRNQRIALIRNLAGDFIMQEKIETSLAKAKSLRPFVEKLITKGKMQTLANRKQLATQLPEKAAKKVYDDLGQRFKDRAGGYTRITKLPPRRGDGSERAIIEFVS